jgi:dihydrofolate reductase
MVNLILACDQNNGIGINNNLPWSIKEDLYFFSRITKNNIVIMGRNTWNSLPNKPLKNRLNIVITSTPLIEVNKNVITFNNIDECLETYKSDSRMLFIIGGKMIYEYFIKNIKLVNNIFLTRINDNYNCNITVNKINDIISNIQNQEIIYNGICFDRINNKNIDITIYKYIVI